MSSVGGMHVALFYGHVASNIGDLAINTGTMRLLADHSEVHRVTVVLLDADRNQYLKQARQSLAAFPNVRISSFKSHGDKAIRYTLNPAAFLEETETRDCDLILLSSGEHLFGYVDLDNRKPLFWRTFPAFAAHHCGIPCALLPSTLGPFETPESRALMQAFLGGLDQVSARDVVTSHLVESQFEASAPPVLLDPAFFLGLGEKGTAAGASGSSGRKVALVMRMDGQGIRVADSTVNADGNRANVAALAGSRAARFSTALCFRLLEDPDCTVHVYVQTAADRDLAEHVVAQVNDQDRVSIHRPASVDEYVDLLGSADQVVASRFHALVIGLSMGKSVFGIRMPGHGHKMPGMLESLGLDDRCFDLSNASPEKLAEVVAERVCKASSGLGRKPAKLLKSAEKSTREWLIEATRLAKRTPALSGNAEVAAFGEYARQLAAESIQLVHKKKMQSVNRARSEQAEQFAQLERQLEEERQAFQQKGEQIDRLEHRISAMQEILDEIRAASCRQLEEASRALTAERQKSERLDQAHREETLRVQVLEGELADSRKQADEWAARAEVLEQELNQARDLGERRNKALEARLRNLEGSTKYQLGAMLAQAFARPTSSLRIPGQLYRLWRERRGRPVDESRVESLPGNHPLVKAYRHGGVEKVEGMIRSAGWSSRKLALELLRVGKGMEGAVGPGSEMKFARRALELDRSVGVLRGAFWASQREGDLETGCDLVLEIEAKLQGSRSQKEHLRLAQLKRTPSYQLAMARNVPRRRDPVRDPVKGRICYLLHNSLPYSSGGYATRTHGLSRGFVAAGYEVHAITRPGYPVDIVEGLDGEDVTLHEQIDGIHYHRLLSPRSRGVPVADYVRQSADELEKLISRLNPEIVIAASNHRVGIMGLIAARRMGIPFVYEVRGWWEVTRQSRDPDFVQHPSYAVQRTLETFTCHEADLVFTLTGAMKEELVDRGVDEGKIRILPNSCNPEQFSRRDRDRELQDELGIPANVPVIGYVGTFVDYEGLELLAQACGQLKNAGHRFRLLLVGNENASGHDRGPITEEILSIARSDDFSGWLIMPGRVPHEDVHRYYSLIDIAPFPRKPWPVCEMVSPMKPLEALAMEKAVVVSSVAALKEMIRDGESGLVFQKGSVDSLRDTLATLLSDDAMRQQLGATGRKWVERERTWDHVARQAAEQLARLG